MTLPFPRGPPPGCFNRERRTFFHLPFSGSCYISHSFTCSSVLSSHPHPAAGSDFFVRYSFAEHLQYATDKNRIQGEKYYKTGFLQKIFLKCFENFFFMHVDATEAYMMLKFFCCFLCTQVISVMNYVHFLIFSGDRDRFVKTIGRD